MSFLMADETFVQLSWKHISKLCDETPHSGGGWSSGGSCIGKQLLESELHLPFNHGSTLPGSIGHKYMQTEVYLVGGKYFDRYEIVGHEVPVMMKINNKLRWSYIDTLVYDFIDSCFEIWDYKFNQFVKYVIDDGKAKDTALMQVNLYADLYGAKRFRVIYTGMGNYSQGISFLYETNHEMAIAGMNRLAEIDYMKSKKLVKPWHIVAEDCYKEKGACTYCDFAKPIENEKGEQIHPAHCLKRFAEEFGQEFTTLNKVKKYMEEHNIGTTPIPTP